MRRLEQAHLGKKFWDARAQGDETSIKAACIHFQNAAGAFLKAQELCKEGKVAGDGDISLDALSILQQQMLGQAHECILTKALLGGRKSPLGPRIAFQVRPAGFCNQHGVNGRPLKRAAAHLAAARTTCS